MVMELSIPAVRREVRAATAHAFGAWAIALLVLAAASWLANNQVAVAVQIVAAPVIFALVAMGYFRRPRPLSPTQSAFVFAAVALGADLLVALFVRWGAFEGLHDVVRAILVTGIVVATTWLAGVATTCGDRTSLT